MKKSLPIITIFLSLSFGEINAEELQHSIEAPESHPDVMSYVQAELPPLIKNYKYAFLGLSLNAHEMKMHNFRNNYDYQANIGSTVWQGVLGGKIRINELFTIPVFSALSFSRIDSNSVGYLFGDELAEEDLNPGNGGIFIGSGLVINHRVFGGGIFAGYYGRFYGDNSSFPFKIAIAPDVNTNQLAYIGKVLDKIAGFIGMGDMTSGISNEEEGLEKDVAWLINTLNLGLDFTFSKISLPSVDLNMKALYRRDMYSAAAKTDTYGFAFSAIWASFVTRIEFGYKHFLSVAEYFESRYFNTGYIDIHAGYQFSRNFTMIGIYRYDGVSGHRFGFGFNFFNQSFTTALGWKMER
jgi:hypothetical protein